MTSGFSNRCGAVAIVAAALVASSLILGGAGLIARAQSTPSEDGHGLQGTWHVQVQIVDCTTGVADGRPFRSLVSFADGGTATGTTSNPAFQPGQRSEEHGIWSHVNDATFSSVREAFILFTTAPNPPVPGFTTGTQRITEAIKVEGDQFTSTASIQFFDVSGNLLRSACATAAARRFK